MSGEGRLWLELLGQEKPEAIEQAFKDQLASSPFFPRPADILARIDERKEREFAARDMEKTEAYMDDLRKTREQLKSDGQAYGAEQFNQILRKAAETVDLIKNLQAKEVEPVKRREYLEAQRRELMARKKA